VTPLPFPRSAEHCGTFRTSIDNLASSGDRTGAVGPETLLGSVLGVYRLDEVVGAGAVGVVYRAWDRRSGHAVAVKVRREGLLATPSQRRRFRMEALALGRCSHPNVAAVLDFGTCFRRDYLVMEIVEGQAVSDMLGGEALSSAHVAYLGEQLARGLAAAHDAGVIHRDIKPGNLRVTLTGELKIVDFGLARPGGRSVALAPAFAREGTGIAGTLPYMAPEQISGDGADERTDVYGAGVVLFEMACGRRPFQNTDLLALIIDIRLLAPESTYACNATIWPSLDHDILKSLAKRPDDRFQSAAELADHLARIAAPAPLTSGPRSTRIWRSMASGVVRALGLHARQSLFDAIVR
jgi:serine/threonine protein kinase